MILKQHLMLINEKENIIRVYRTSLAFCAVPSLSVGLRVCGFAGLRVCGFAGLRRSQRTLHQSSLSLRGVPNPDTSQKFPLLLFFELRAVNICLLCKECVDVVFQTPDATTTINTIRGI